MEPMGTVAMAVGSRWARAYYVGLQRPQDKDRCVAVNYRA